MALAAVCARSVRPAPIATGLAPQGVDNGGRTSRIVTHTKDAPADQPAKQPSASPGPSPAAKPSAGKTPAKTDAKTQPGTAGKPTVPAAPGQPEPEKKEPVPDLVKEGKRDGPEKPAGDKEYMTMAAVDGDKALPDDGEKCKEAKVADPNAKEYMTLHGVEDKDLLPDDGEKIKAKPAADPKAQEYMTLHGVDEEAALPKDEAAPVIPEKKTAKDVVKNLLKK